MSARGHIVVVGLGYIGLPTAAILATNGYDVTGIDVNPRHIEAVNSGRIPFVENDLEDFVSKAVAEGTLRAQTDVPHANVYIVAVPTPFKGDHEADLSYIEQAAGQIAPQLRGDELVILESTSPPGATQQLADWVLAQRPDLNIDQANEKTVHFAHCPERVLPGRIMIELVTNDRIIGGLTPVAAEKARDVYASFCDAELLLTDAMTAEMAKLVENSFRDVNIAFANELSVISDELGINVWELIELANRHPRVNILQPGPGVGGHCIAVDPWFIVDAVPQQAQLIRLAREVNDSKPQTVIDKVAAAAELFETPKIALLGLAFKPNIDDLRESPAKAIAERLSKELPAQYLVSEPNIEVLPETLVGRENVELADYNTAIEAADIVVLLVDHDEFKAVPRERVADKAVIDTRGVWR